MNPAALIIAVLRVASGVLAFVSAFGFLFFLSSQGTSMTLYTAASVAALSYFAFCPRHILATAGGRRTAVILSAAASAFTSVKLYGEFTHPLGPALDMAAFRAVELFIFLVMVLESRWLKQQPSQNAV